MSLAGARVAIVHDWLQGMHGSERTVEAMITTAFRDAERCDLFTFHAAHDVLSETLSAAVVRDAALTHLPGIRQRDHDPGRWRLLAPFMTRWFESLPLDGYDIVVCSSHAFAVAAHPRRPGVLHACYCYTPIRYVWERAIDGQRLTGAKHAASAALVGRMRRQDLRSAARPRGHIAISTAVAERIRSAYGRDAPVVHPPVEVGEFGPGDERDPDHFAWVHRLTPYKRPLEVVEAFRAMPSLRLTMVGVGPLAGRAARLPAAERDAARLDLPGRARRPARARRRVRPCRRRGLRDLDGRGARRGHARARDRPRRRRRHRLRRRDRDPDLRRPARRDPRRARAPAQHVVRRCRADRLGAAVLARALRARAARASRRPGDRRVSRVSVVVPSLRGGARLVALARRLTAAGAEVRIADNGMPAADAAELAAIGATIVAMDGNAGFARAVNAAADGAGGAALVVLNDDIEPCDGFLDALVARLAHAAMVAGVLLKAEAPELVETAGIVIDRHLGAYDHLQDEPVAVARRRGRPAARPVRRCGGLPARGVRRAPAATTPASSPTSRTSISRSACGSPASAARSRATRGRCTPARRRSAMTPSARRCSSAPAAAGSCASTGCCGPRGRPRGCSRRRRRPRSSSPGAIARSGRRRRAGGATRTADARATRPPAGGGRRLAARRAAATLRALAAGDGRMTRCPLCDGAVEPTGRYGIALDRCAACGSCFAREGRPQAVRSYASDDYLARNEGVQVDARQRRYEARLRLRWMRSRVGRGSLFEAGAAAGYFLDEARAAGFAVSGVEPSPTLSEFARQTHGLRGRPAACSRTRPPASPPTSSAYGTSSSTPATRSRCCATSPAGSSRRPRVRRGAEHRQPGARPGCGCAGRRSRAPST